MDSTFGVLFLLWSLLERWCGRGGSEAPARPGAEPRQPAPVVPAPTPGLTAPPWPQVVPSDLPTFPGRGWEYDEPPPKAVQVRAGQLLDVLWKLGKGTHKTEQTAGRWITYQAQTVASGKKGVVAYRVKKTAAPAPEAPPELVARRTPGIAKARPRGPVVPASTRPRVVPASGRVQRPENPLGLPVLRYGRGLKPAAPDANVRIAQTKLGVTPDGRFGSGTRAAVRAFQSKNKLTPDGVVGPNTWAALFRTV